MRCVTIVPALLAGTVACASLSLGPIPAEFGDRHSITIASRSLTVAHEFTSGLTDSTRVLVRDREQWVEVWSRIHANRQNPPPAPDVAFDEELVVVAALGQRPSGGYNIGIDSVVQHEHGAVAYVSRHAPGPQCAVTEALTQPVHALRVPRFEGQILFVERTFVSECGDAALRAVP